MFSLLKKTKKSACIKRKRFFFLWGANVPSQLCTVGRVVKFPQNPKFLKPKIFFFFLINFFLSVNQSLFKKNLSVRFWYMGMSWGFFKSVVRLCYATFAPQCGNGFVWLNFFLKLSETKSYFHCKNQTKGRLKHLEVWFCWFF